MGTFRFHFSTQYAVDLRDAVNDRQKHSIDHKHKEKNLKEYYAWDRTCAAMDRIDDTIHYLNSMELGSRTDTRSAFDFFDFINNMYVLIDCIKTIGGIFRLDNHFIEDIEKSTDVFDKPSGTGFTDGRYFEYIRSLCSVHPLCTNHQKEFLHGDQFHCCPYVFWNGSLAPHCVSGDLYAKIYTSQNESDSFYIGLYVFQFEKYLTKWIDLIPEIIKAKNKYTDDVYEDFRKSPVKQLSDFGNNVIEYLKYLKEEYSKRFDDTFEFLFDNYILFFTIKLSNLQNEELLKKYQNAIRYALRFLRNELQNMSYEGYDNNGLQHPDRNIETTLFFELGDISPYNCNFAKHSYALEKMYYLTDDYSYSYYDKVMARELLNGPKEMINRYVVFTNDESDEERVVLVTLALYFDSLTTNNVLNRNIPNEIQYRKTVLTDAEYAEFMAPDSEPEIKDFDGSKLKELLELYGG